MKRPRSPCFAGQQRRLKVLRRLHPASAASAAPLLQRKRSLDCGLDRTPGSPPPVKRPRLEGSVYDSHAFLWEVQETSKEPTFGFQAQQATQEWRQRQRGTRRDGRAGAVAAGHVTDGRPGAAHGRTGRRLRQAGPVRGAHVRTAAARRRRHGAVQPAGIGRRRPGVQRLQLLEDAVPRRQRRRRHGVMRGKTSRHRLKPIHCAFLLAAYNVT